MKYILILLVTVSSAQAFEFKEFLNRTKDRVNTLLGKEEKKEEVLELPEIPKIKQNVLDVGVYNKVGVVHAQGSKFTSLSNEAKRKYQISFLQDLYEATLQEQITHEELAKFLNVLEQGGTREGIYRSLVLGQEYSAKESSSSLTSENLANTILEFATVYLALKFDKEQIKKLSRYTVKRVMAEKCLEVMDSFPTDGKDLYQWYAVMSVDFAQKYSQFFTNKSRLSTNLEYHKKWASSVPFQHIKSEVVVKLHRIVNGLK